MEKLRVLLLDDVKPTNYIHKKYLEHTLEHVGVTYFQKGIDALEYLESVDPTKYPHWVFVDINMPSMNCWTFFENWIERSLPIPGSTRIYILTTSITPGDQIRRQNYEFIHDILYKPLNPDIINKVYREYEAETGFRKLDPSIR